ncbi:hypothetical protein ACS0PU_001490 [Formica fusca]
MEYSYMWCAKGHQRAYGREEREGFGSRANGFGCRMEGKITRRQFGSGLLIATSASTFGKRMNMMNSVRGVTSLPRRYLGTRFPHRFPLCMRRPKDIQLKRPQEQRMDSCHSNETDSTEPKVAILNSFAVVNPEAEFEES